MAQPQSRPVLIGILRMRSNYCLVGFSCITSDTGQFFWCGCRQIMREMWLDLCTSHMLSNVKDVFALLLTIAWSRIFINALSFEKNPKLWLYRRMYFIKRLFYETSPIIDLRLKVTKWLTNDHQQNISKPIGCIIVHKSGDSPIIRTSELCRPAMLQLFLRFDLLLFITYAPV